MTDAETILWQRLDVPGHEIASIVPHSDEWLVNGVAVFVEAGNPCRVEYDIRCERAMDNPSLLAARLDWRKTGASRHRAE